MKTRETKAKDLAALTESLQNAKSAMIVSFSGLSVAKDQEFRNGLRAAGANYRVVKNTLARLAVKGTDFEQASEAFKGVTAIAWTDSDAVVLSKAISKFMKENADIYTFKTGVVDGKLVDFSQVTEIASLPSKEELISKLLFVLNAQAQRIVTVINAVPRDLAVVIKQIGDNAPAASAEPANAEEPKAEEPQAAAPVADEPAPEAAAAEEEASEASGGDDNNADAPVEQAEEAQETLENEQDPGSPEAEQANQAENAEEKPAE
ncbi:MAG TPA: 50S ribosomal protein L10 [Pyrinomonadaceae bacterium]|nr:50S ribosomal protein L10 [Pyrinomonadaceae bacterium]HMP64458.1 50S ribosomal protein L10 [Pyrinomonadaceae bacterium]